MVSAYEFPFQSLYRHLPLECSRLLRRRRDRQIFRSYADGCQKRRGRPPSTLHFRVQKSRAPWHLCRRQSAAQSQAGRRHQRRRLCSARRLRQRAGFCGERRPLRDYFFRHVWSHPGSIYDRDPNTRRIIPRIRGSWSFAPQPAHLGSESQRPHDCASGGLAVVGHSGSARNAGRRLDQR